MKRAATALLTALLTSCAASVTPWPATAALTETACTVEYDAARDVKTISSPMWQRGRTHIFLRAWGPKFTNAQVYAHLNLREWYFLKSAWCKGEKLGFTKISSDVGYGGYSVSETVGANVNANFLSSHLNGFTIGFRGQRAFNVTVPGHVVRGFMRAWFRNMPSVAKRARELGVDVDSILAGGGVGKPRAPAPTPTATEATEATEVGEYVHTGPRGRVDPDYERWRAKQQ